MGAGAEPGRLFCCSFPRSDNRVGQLSTQSGVYLWSRGRKKEVIVRGGIEHLAPGGRLATPLALAAARPAQRPARELVRVEGPRCVQFDSGEHGRSRASSCQVQQLHFTR